MNTTWPPANYTTRTWEANMTSDHVINSSLADGAYMLADGARSSPSDKVRIAFLFIFGTIFILSLFGNSMVLYVIAQHLRYKTVTNIFISALSTCDLLNTVICMPVSFATIAGQRWPLGEQGCVLNGFVFGLLEAVSLIMVTLITLDRFVVVVKICPQAYSKRTACVAIVSTVCLASCFSCPWFLADVDGLLDRWRRHAVSTTDTFYKVGFSHCMYAFHAGTSANGPVYSLLYTIIWYVLPCGCMTYAAACLIKVIRNSDNQIRPTTTHFNELRFSGEIRTSKTVLYMYLFCFLCKGPYFISGIVYFSTNDLRPKPNTDTVLTLITWCACAINPLLYAVRNPTVGRILRRRNDTWYTPNQPPPDVVLSSAGADSDRKRSGQTTFADGAGRMANFQTDTTTTTTGRRSPEPSPRSANGFQDAPSRRAAKYRLGLRRDAKTRYIASDTNDSEIAYVAGLATPVASNATALSTV